MTDEKAREYADLVKERELNLDKFNELLTWVIDPEELFEALLEYHFSISNILAYQNEIERDTPTLAPPPEMLYHLQLFIEAVRYSYTFPKM